MSEKNYKKSVGIIIQDNLGRILWLKRKSSGLWAIPGGKVDEGETFLEAAKRELNEEVAIDNIELELFSCTTSYTHDIHRKEQTFIGYVDHTIDFRNAEEHKFEWVKFVHLDDIPPFSQIEAFDHIIIEQLRGEKVRELEH